MKKYIIFSKNFNHLEILQNSIPKLSKYQFISTDDIGILKDTIKSSQNNPLYLILDFENEKIEEIRAFAYECIKLRENIKCILLPSNLFNICHQKIGLVHFVKKGIIVNNFKELVEEVKKTS